MELRVANHAIVFTALVGTFSIAARPGVAQAPRVLSGRVVDSDGRPIQNARVWVRSFNDRSVSTGEDGRFRLSLAADDTVTVDVLMIGREKRTYRLDSLEALVGRGENVVLDKVPFALYTPPPRTQPPNFLDDTIPNLARGAMARAAGLKPLYESGPESPREIRLTTNWGLGAPDLMVVLRQNGHRITGEVFYAFGRHVQKFDRVDTTALLDQRRRAGCSQPRIMDETSADSESNVVPVTVVCRPQVRKTPKWNSLWQALEKVDVWTLPDDDDLTWNGIVGTHGACVTIETLDKKYRRVEHCEGWLVASPEATRAERVVQLVESVLPIIR